MTEFEFDCLEKKRLARCAAAKVGARRTVTLPSDRLSEQALQRKNGPCRTYRLGQPMDIGSFHTLPRDLQRAYLRRLQAHGGSTDAVAAMFGITPQTLNTLLHGFGVRFDQPDEARWRRFLQR